MNRTEIDAQVRIDWLTVLEGILTAEEYSAYGIHTVLNQVLVANGLDKIRPQMMYNYARNGLIVKGAKIFGQSLRNFTKDEVAEFIVRYSHRNGVEVKVGQPAADPNQLVLDLDSVTEVTTK